MEISLADDVNECVDSLMKAKFRDVESDMIYIVKFMNDRKLWQIEIESSPDADIPKEDKQAFFKSECWKKTCRRAVEIFERDKKTMDQYVTPKLEDGMLLKVDELKYGKIDKYLSDPELMKNIKLHKYIH